ncbi:MAG: MgtC/SapB family protein [Thioalkalivibrio sp.]|nr:MgtC/SapB family protein [Thioalkalivibrio sp.]
MAVSATEGRAILVDITQIYALGVALAIGLLIGLERGWKEREQDEGRRIAGIRTFALIGLLGGIWGLLAEQTHAALLVAAFAVVALVLVTAYAISLYREEDADVGVTGIIAGLLTFALGAMASLGYEFLAVIGAVVTTILLGTKPVLHKWLRGLEPYELYAALKFLVISLVILPLLPNRGFGPWEALNPYQIWWMVVLIAGISFVGYFAMKIVGERKGILATGVFAGLASSTAATVSLARIARASRGAEEVLAAGILVAGATMFPRLLVITSIFSWSVTKLLLGPVLVMAAVNYLAAAIFWFRSRHAAGSGQARLHNPFELGPALIFAALLAALMLLSRALSDWYGDTGIYALAALSGIADVDAITLSLVRMADGEITIAVAAGGVLLAAFVNAMIKAGLALGIGGAALGLRTGLTTVLVIASGATVWWFA